MPKFHPAPDQKYHAQQQVDQSRLMPPQDARMMQPEPPRMMQQQQEAPRLLNEHGHHLLPDNRALLNDNRLLANDQAARLLVNVTEPPRLLVNEAPRLLPNDARLMAGVSDNSRIVVNERHLAVVEGGRLLTDKYLTGYDPYHRGHL